MSETELKKIEVWCSGTSVVWHWEDLNYDERTKVLEAYQNTEDRNESDKVAPREEDVKDYYEDNVEKFGFVRTLKPTIEMLEKALNRWHENLFPDTKHADFNRDTNVAKGKVAMIEHVLWWIDAVRRGEVSE